MGVDPATLRLRVYPDPVLRQVARPIEKVTAEVRAVAARMLQMMVEEDGIGLAAPQVGLAWRMFVVHVPATEGRSAGVDPATATAGPTVYVNPKITATGAVQRGEEGCLSLPEIRGDVFRPLVAEITAWDIEGQAFTQRGAGLLARCWQHENDHLDGVLIIDKMPPLHRLKNRSKLRDLEQDA